MAPKLTHLLIAFVMFFSIQSFVCQARTLKSERQQSFSSFLQKLEGVQKGQTAEEVIELKQFLKKFGYFPIDDNNIMTNDFDDHLESALKTYQKYFHLTITGNLDSATIKQMMIPRCGMPDIIPNNTKSKHKKFHMVAHYAYGNEKWPPSKYNLTYRFGSGCVPVVDLNTLRTVYSNAFKNWSDVSKFSFQEATDAASADIVIEFYSSDHRDNFPLMDVGTNWLMLFFPKMAVSITMQR